jgi:hypothetical protein
MNSYEIEATAFHLQKIVFVTLLIHGRNVVIGKIGSTSYIDLLMIQDKRRLILRALHFNLAKSCQFMITVNHFSVHFDPRFDIVCIGSPPVPYIPQMNIGDLSAETIRAIF